MYKKEFMKYVLDCDMTAHVFEKENVRLKDTKKDTKIYKDGFHIVFYNVVVSEKIQKQIHMDVQTELITDEYFQYIQKFIENKGKIKELIDDISSNNWMLYGYKKPEDWYSWKLTKILYDNEEIFQDIESEDIDCKNLTTLYKTQSELSSLGKQVEYSGSKNYSKIEIVDEIGGVTYDEDIVIEWLTILDKKRSDNFKEWVEVGLLLHNISNPKHHYLAAYVNWSKQSEKFVEGECEKRWKTFTKKESEGLQLASLKYWARNDDPVEFENIKVKFLSRQIKKCTDSDTFIYMGGCSDFEIAKILYSYFKTELKCNHIKNNTTWYHFENHRWVPNADYFLMNILNNDITNMFKKMCSDIALHVGDDLKVQNKRKEMIGKVIKKTSNYNSKLPIINECANLFHDEIFLETMDTKPNIICFKNGVFDTNNLTFRDGVPEDYVTCACPHNLNTQYTNESPEIIELHEILDEILPKKDVKESFLTYVSSCLTGYTEHQKFVILTGSGANGKSLIINLIRRSFGTDYQGTCPESLLTQNRPSANSHTDSLCAIATKRIAICQEPDTNSTIHAGSMKEFTGGDQIYVREMFTKGQIKQPTFKLFMVCNDIPHITGTDDGTMRRITIIPFISKFKDKHKIDKNVSEYQYEKDETLQRKLTQFCEPFLWVLVYQYLIPYMKNNMYINWPNDCIEATQEYQHQNDHLSNFFDTHYEKTENVEDIVSKKDMFKTFKFWCSENDVSKKMTYHEFVKSLKNIKDIKENQKHSFIFLQNKIIED
eukprot:gene2479-3219_t